MTEVSADNHLGAACFWGRLRAHLHVMEIERFGVLAARAAGLVLSLLGATNLLAFVVLHFFQPATAGWTSYSPLAPEVSMAEELLLHDAYYVVSDLSLGVLPGAVQVAVGLSMILLSRLMGRLLVSGMKSESAQQGSSAP